MPISSSYGAIRVSVGWVRVDGVHDAVSLEEGTGQAHARVETKISHGWVKLMKGRKSDDGMQKEEVLLMTMGEVRIVIYLYSSLFTTNYYYTLSYNTNKLPG